MSILNYLCILACLVILVILPTPHAPSGPPTCRIPLVPIEVGSGLRPHSWYLLKDQIPEKRAEARVYLTPDEMKAT